MLTRRHFPTLSLPSLGSQDFGEKEAIIADKQKKIRKTKTEMEKLSVRFGFVLFRRVALSSWSFVPSSADTLLPSFHLSTLIFHLQAQAEEVKANTHELERKQEELQNQLEPTRFEMQETAAKLKKMRVESKEMGVCLNLLFSLSVSYSSSSRLTFRFRFSRWLFVGS